MSCNRGVQRRRVPCQNLRGRKIPRSYCDTKLRPQRRRKCYLRPCSPISCHDVHKRGSVVSDGDYDLLIRGRMVKIYCADMQTGNPIEYLTLRTGHIENFSEIYSKRLEKNASNQLSRKCLIKSLTFTKCTKVHYFYKTLSAIPYSLNRNNKRSS